jgi:iron complex outermembrane receptor protein
LDLELQASVTDNLTLRAGGAFLDTEYTEFETGILCSTRLPDGHTVYTPPCSPKGNELVRSPEWTFNLGMMYRRPVDFGFIGGSFDYKWTDDFFWEIDNRLVEPSYGLLNGQLFWQTADERWGVSVWGRNITDEEYSMFAVAQASCGAVCPTPANPAGNPFGIGDQYAAAAPRTWGVELNFKF